MTEKEELDLTERRETMLSTLVELETIISNALGKLAEGENVNLKIPKPEKVDVERLAAKPMTTGTPEEFKLAKQKLLPNNLMYKAPALEEGVTPVEPVEPAEDSQDKDLTAALEVALEKLRNIKYTAKIPAKDFQTPTGDY